MQVISSVADWKKLRPTLKGTLGLVPTMGALHAGHLSLVRRSRAENDLTVVWIFVNPKQFAPSEDFERYPRDFEGDRRLLQQEAVDYIFSPGVDDVYPPHFQTYVTVESLTKPLEGAQRPTHFRGVTTVVAKMLCLTQPTRAYFGQKDAQQSIVVRRMASDLGMLTEIVVCPTVREPDGLAMSSRNVYLNPGQRAFATTLHRALLETERAIHGGARDAEALRQRVRALFAGHDGVQIDYVSIADPETLEELTTVRQQTLVLLAVRVGTTRLIDNMLIRAPDGAP